MSASRLVLQVPTRSQRVTLPYLPGSSFPDGRKQPNGTTTAVDEASPSSFYKLTPWQKSLLAFNEIDTYAKLRAIKGPTGIAQLLGVAGTEEHLVRIFERSHKGSLGKFLLDTAKGDHGLIDPVLVRSLLAQIAETMAHIHALDIVHRDLKAENILVFDADADAGHWWTVRAKVSDFDRAVELRDGERLEDPVGSLFHMAPELFARETYDRKIDVYAFGILMFEVAHGGRRAYANVATSMPGALSKTEFARKVVEENFRPAWTHEDEFLKRLAARCSAANTDDRPEFQEVFDLLKPHSSWHRLLSLHTPAQQNRCGFDTIDGIGIASSIGKVRTKMEDSACVLKTSDVLVAGVFDGLRGHRASEISARQFSMVLLDEMSKDAGDAEAAMGRTFRRVDATLRHIEPPIACGSTAVVALVREADLLVSWLGDSPAYLFRTAGPGAEVSALPLIEKHHPTRDDEAARVAANGGVVRREQRLLDNGEAVPWGPLRVFVPTGGQTAGFGLSRALGLFAFKPAIGDQPEMLHLRRQDDDLFLVLGSDGIFDVLSPDAVYECTASAGSAQHAADRIIDAVLRSGAPDNASVVVVDLRQPRSG